MRNLRKKGSILISILLTAAMIVGCSKGSVVNSTSSSPSSNTESQNASSEFYKDKTIEVIVPFGPGGGTDVAARFLQTYLTKYIEGHPAIQIVNVPGAGAINGSNQFAFKKPDGYTMLGSSSSVLVQWLMGKSEVKFDVKKMIPIIAMPHNSIMSISPSTGYKEPKDLLNPKEQLTWGASDVTSGDIRLLLALEVLKLTDKMKIVYGYDGGGAAGIAYEQGEVNMDSQTTSAYLTKTTQLEKEGKSIPLFQIGMLDDKGQFVRDPAVPNIRTVSELYKEMYGQEPSGETYEALKVFGGLVNNMHKTIFIHADAPKEAVTLLKDAVKKLAEDPEFKSKAPAILGTERVVIGEELEMVTKQVQEINEETIKYVRKLSSEKYGATGLKF